MRLEQFQYVVEIARYKSMSKAAKKLFITQPSLSIAIQNLEEELGYQIFRRSSHGVSLTPQGEQLVEIAEVIVQQIERVKAISGIQEQVAGDVFLVAAPVTCNALIFELMFTLKKDYPNINLNITERRPSKTIQSLVEGPATIGIGTYSLSTREITMQEAAKNNLIIEDLYEDEMVVFLHHQHPLLRKKSIKLADLEPFTQAFFKDHATMTTFESPSDKQPLSHNYFTFSDRESIKKAVAQGFAYAILPKLMALDDIYVQSGLITPVPISDFGVTLTTYMAYSAKSRPTLIETRTMETIRNLYTRLQKENPVPTPLPQEQASTKRGQVYY